MRLGRGSVPQYKRGHRSPPRITAIPLHSNPSSIITQLYKTHSAAVCLTPIEHNMSTQLDAASLARLSKHDPSNFGIQHAQTLHRLALLQHWNIPVGSKVLELGCGQGDCTTALASAVGEQGRVVAVDPAPLDYGAFFTSLTLSSLRTAAD